jgi:hypothetical protein
MKTLRKYLNAQDEQIKIDFLIKLTLNTIRVNSFKCCLIHLSIDIPKCRPQVKLV